MEGDGLWASGLRCGLEFGPLLFVLGSNSGLQKYHFFPFFLHNQLFSFSLIFMQKYTIKSYKIK